MNNRMIVRGLVATMLLAVSAAGHAKAHRASTCSIHVSDFSAGGKPLSYERVRKAAAPAHMASNGTVYVPVVQPNGRSAVYAIAADGCARRTLIRTLR